MTSSDKLKKRGIPVGTALALWWGFNLGALVVRYSDNHGKRLAMMIMALAFSNIWRKQYDSRLAPKYLTQVSQIP